MATSTAEAERLRAKALARWEGEGGALGAPPETLDESELRILARLGAGMLWHWSEIPDAARAGIWRRATTLHAEADADRIRQRIDAFLAEHKDL